MFFVGLAGSIIPYILLMGVMLVFTLGVNAEEMEKLSPEKREANFLKVEIPHTDCDNNPFNFHFYAYKPVDESSKERIKDLSDEGVSCMYVKVEISPFNLFFEIQPHYRSNFCTRYFGLSPPLMV